MQQRFTVSSNVFFSISHYWAVITGFGKGFNPKECIFPHWNHLSVYQYKPGRATQQVTQTGFNYIYIYCIHSLTRNSARTNHMLVQEEYSIMSAVDYPEAWHRDWRIFIHIDTSGGFLINIAQKESCTRLLCSTDHYEITIPR